MKAYTLWYRQDNKKYSQVFYAETLDEAWEAFNNFLGNERQYISYTSGIIGCVINLFHLCTR